MKVIQSSNERELKWNVTAVNNKHRWYDTTVDKKIMSVMQVT